MDINTDSRYFDVLLLEVDNKILQTDKVWSEGKLGLRLWYGVAVFCFLIVLGAYSYFVYVPFLSEFIGSPQFSPQPVQGNGKWLRDEVTFFIENRGLITQQKEEVIRQSVISIEPFRDGYLGWNGALAELNQIYPKNTVPDRLIEVFEQRKADIIIKPSVIQNGTLGGTSINSISPFGIIITSNVILFEVDDFFPKIVGAISRHEIGHAIGLEHTQRENDIMNEDLMFSDIPIKKQNIVDLFEKYG